MADVIAALFRRARARKARARRMPYGEAHHAARRRALENWARHRP